MENDRQVKIVYPMNVLQQISLLVLDDDDENNAIE